MDRRGRELVAPDESTFVAKSFLDPIVMKNGQDDTGLPNPSNTDESDWTEAFSEMNNPLD